MTAVTKLLAAISSALLVPVLIGLCSLLGWAVALTGGAIREWWDRRQWQQRRPDLLVQLRHTTRDSLTSEERTLILASFGLHPWLSSYGRVSLVCSRIGAAKAAADLELDAETSIAQGQWGSRIAPMLGLMGTLIPLASGLIGLSEAKLDALFDSLVVAFATTVVGLLISALAYTVTELRRGWYTRDISDLRYLSNLLMEGDCLEARSEE